MLVLYFKNVYNNYNVENIKTGGKSKWNQK